MILEAINSPNDLKALPEDQLPILSAEIRQKLLETVSKNGGHLASNLCVVELTVALHRVFDSPHDSIIFDVGHQSYVHKLLTGRCGEFSALRKFGGISGFPKRSESEHDSFGTGHSSTSISAAAGIAAANLLSGSDAYTVAVVGDGAFTGGMIYEALNNCADKDRLIIVLNDNDMSISPNVGGMSRYFSKFRSSAKYFRVKNGTKRFFSKLPLIGNGLIRGARTVKNSLKRIVLSQNFFEQFGLSYYGPLDGNDERHLEQVLREAKLDGKCSVVHICTVKGKGYAPAEKRPDVFHGVSGFDIETGIVRNGGTESFSERFGRLICDRAETDERIVAITAAMPDGTGLSEFSRRFPERFFDVGIAEEHAVTFACGLAVKNYIPVFAVYSTFMQRAFDQFIHDAALQGLHVILALDRAGLVGADGATHHGIFDAAFISEIPGVDLYAPADFAEFEQCFDRALSACGPVVIRYAKSGENIVQADKVLDGLCYSDIGTSPEAAIISYGRLSDNAFGAAEKLIGRGISSRVIRLCRLSPLPLEDMFSLIKDTDTVLFAEEGIKNGGIAQRFFAEAAEAGILGGKRCLIKAIDDEFPSHGNNDKLFECLGLSADSIADAIEKARGGE